MNNYKKLYRIKNGRMVTGVCGGIAEYFNIDPSLVRIGMVIFSCVGGAGIVVYVAASIILPEQDD